MVINNLIAEAALVVWTQNLFFLVSAHTLLLTLWSQCLLTRHAAPTLLVCFRCTQDFPQSINIFLPLFPLFFCKADADSFTHVTLLWISCVYSDVKMF